MRSTRCELFMSFTYLKKWLWLPLEWLLCLIDMFMVLLMKSNSES